MFYLDNLFSYGPIDTDPRLTTCLRIVSPALTHCLSRLYWLDTVSVLQAYLGLKVVQKLSYNDLM